MATITTDTYLDEGAFRTPGEVWTINGPRFIIRTDTRWHARMPASGTVLVGTLGNVTISSTLGGSWEIDGTRVRWLRYTGGTGSVPAFNTLVTQAGQATGVFLGVWSSLTSAPTATGQLMPASGFIKFREVDGQFSAGALSGIGATAAEPDKVGWIEVVADQAATFTIPRLGKFVVRGAMFELGRTNGTAGQILQVPTNGSSTTYVPGVFVSTVPNPTGMDQYEFYPSIRASDMSTTNFGIDARSKVVLMGTDGTIRFGHNGTTTVGYVPPSGMLVVVPNVFGRQCLTSSRNLNAIPHATLATRPEFLTTSAGEIDVEHFMTDWYFNLLQPYKTTIKRSSTFDTIYLSECADLYLLEDVGIGGKTVANAGLTLLSNFTGGTVRRLKVFRMDAATNGHDISVSLCANLLLEDVHCGIVTYARSSGFPLYLSQCTNVTCRRVTTYNAGISLVTCSDVLIEDTDHCDRFVGTTNSTTSRYAIAISSLSSRVTVQGLTIGLQGTIQNAHPYSGLFNVSSCSDVTIRNCGSWTNPVPCGTANQVGYIYASSGNNQRIKLQRIYASYVRTAPFSVVNTDYNCVFDNVYALDGALTLIQAANDSVMRSCSGPRTTTGQTSVYRSHFSTHFYGANFATGAVTVHMNEPSAGSSQAAVAGGKFTSTGSLALTATGQVAYWEMPFYSLGHGSFLNALPLVTGTNVTYTAPGIFGNHRIRYQMIDENGNYGPVKDLSQANLISETIPSKGLRMAFTAECITPNTSNLLTYLTVFTTSSTAMLASSLYPLNENKVTLEGLASNSEVRAYVGTDPETAQEIAGQEFVYGATYTFTQSVAGQDGYIVIIHPDYQPLRIDLTYSDQDVTIPVFMSRDRVYKNP